MSHGINWRLPPKQRQSHGLDYSLKYVLGPYLWDQDGTLRTEATLVGKDVAVFLEGVIRTALGEDREALRDAAIELRDAITAHGTVEVFIGDRPLYED